MILDKNHDFQKWQKTDQLWAWKSLNQARSNLKVFRLIQWDVGGKYKSLGFSCFGQGE